LKGQTLSSYSNLIQTILRADYKIYAVDEYIREKPEKNVVVLRHDVDVNPHQALLMAKLERSLGVKSTYYFRYIPRVFNESIIKSIGEMGFEVGYHYETLDKSYGNFPEAISLFKNELESFRKIAPVKTVCSHGNVVRNKHYSGLNYDIFKFSENLLEECNLKAEAYLNMLFSPLVYLSDSIERTSNPFKSVEDLIRRIEMQSEDDINYYILFHPCLWPNGTVDSFKIKLKKTIFHTSAKMFRLLSKGRGCDNNSAQKTSLN